MSLPPSSRFGAAIGSGWPQKGSELNWYGGIRAMDARAEPTNKPGARCMVRRIGLVRLRQFWRAVAIAAFAAISLAPADISAHAQTRDDQPASSLDLGARGGLAKQTSASTAAPSDRQESSVEFSARAGLATDYIYRGTTLSSCVQSFLRWRRLDQRQATERAGG